MSSRVFVDTNVLIAGLLSETGASAELLEMALNRKLNMVLSGLVIEEATRNIKKKAPEFLGDFYLFLKSCPLGIVQSKIKLKRNSRIFPKESDQIIFETAQMSKIDFFASLNRKHFHSPEIKKVAKFKILEPSELLKLLK
jgi:putative PIN family toxin of toxin-antitoxin system